MELFRVKRQARVLRCLAGMQEVAVPVFAGCTHVATLFGGQVFLKPPTPAQFQELAGKLGLNGDAQRCRLEQLYFRTPVFNERQLRAVTRLLVKVAKELCELASAALLQSQADEPPEVTRAKEYLRQHYTEPVRLAQVARLVGVSRSTLAHKFHRTAGLRFDQFVNLLRLTHAQRELADPRRRIADVAFAAGFESIPHFNRVFRKCCGQSPREFRAARNGRATASFAQDAKSFAPLA